MIRTGNPSLDRACEMLDQAGADWDKAFRQFCDKPTEINMRVLQAAQIAYTATQQTYLLAVTVSRLPQLPASVPTPTQEYTDATSNS